MKIEYLVCLESNKHDEFCSFVKSNKLKINHVTLSNKWNEYVYSIKIKEEDLIAIKLKMKVVWMRQSLC